MMHFSSIHSLSRTGLPALASLSFPSARRSGALAYIQDDFRGLKKNKIKMARSTIRILFELLLLATTFLLPLTNAQIGTITQDIFTLTAFPLQKPCAQSCFLYSGFCPSDVLGGAIGCNTQSDCFTNNWEATNNCYCRSDLQQPAQDYLTSCVKKHCDVGDSRIDASSAGSIYANYCVEKGYAFVTAPANVPATTTRSEAIGGVPTASSTSNLQASSSKSVNLTTPEIVGIAVAGVAVLLISLGLLRTVKRRWGDGRSGNAPYRQPPTYPSPYPEPHYQYKVESEVMPDDSISMASGMPRPAPTLLSDVHSYPPRGY
jgi:hypothetical protein